MIDVYFQTVFAKGAHYALPSLSKTDYDIIGLDWTMDPTMARELTGENVTLQGNLDPCALYSKRKNDLEPFVKELCTKFGKKRWIANLGHGIYPDVDPEMMKAFVDLIHKHSKA